MKISSKCQHFYYSDAVCVWSELESVLPAPGEGTARLGACCLHMLEQAWHCMTADDNDVNMSRLESFKWLINQWWNHWISEWTIKELIDKLQFFMETKHNHCKNIHGEWLLWQFLWIFAYIKTFWNTPQLKFSIDDRAFWWCNWNIPRDMMTSSNGNIFRVTGHLCGEFTGPRWIPHTKASDVEL